MKNLVLILNRLGPVTCKQSSVLRKLWITLLSCVQTVGQQSQNSRMRKKLLRSIHYCILMHSRLKPGHCYFFRWTPFPTPAPPLSVNAWSIIGKEAFESFIFMIYFSKWTEREAWYCGQFLEWQLKIWPFSFVSIDKKPFLRCKLRILNRKLVGVNDRGISLYTLAKYMWELWKQMRDNDIVRVCYLSRRLPWRACKKTPGKKKKGLENFWSRRLLNYIKTLI